MSVRYCETTAGSLPSLPKIYTLYRITNTINGHVYVGVHACPHYTFKRANGVIYNLCGGPDVCRYMGSGTAIQNAVRKYGADSFKREVLKQFNSQEEMYAEERRVVNEEFIGRVDTYNLKTGGTVNDSYRYSDEARNHISAALVGKVYGPHTEEWKAAARERSLGNKYSQGTTHSDERKAAARDRMIGNKHALGAKHTEEMRLRTSQRQTGRRRTPESILKYQATRKANERKAGCHPDKKHFALGLCSFCYDQQRHQHPSVG